MRSQSQTQLNETITKKNTSNSEKKKETKIIIYNKVLLKYTIFNS